MTDDCQYEKGAIAYRTISNTTNSLWVQSRHANAKLDICHRYHQTGRRETRTLSEIFLFERGREGQS